jgi:hypothetical protein
MSDHAGAPRDDEGLGPTKHCGAYTPGHEVHFIQARKASEAGPGTPATIRSVADDGTITFADGTTKWNHEPARLRAAIERSGAHVRLGAYGVLKVPHGAGAYCFCLGDAPTPCPGPAEPPASLEDLARLVAERGGFVIPGKEALRLSEQR